MMRRATNRPRTRSRVNSNPRVGATHPFGNRPVTPSSRFSPRLSNRRPGGGGSPMSHPPRWAKYTKPLKKTGGR